MLVTIGQSPTAGGDLVDLLLDCHERIRSFLALARAASEQTHLPETEVLEACSRVERYFIEALPLHVADEEHSILPRLRDRSPDVERALQTMHEEHISHEPRLRALLNASSALRQRPSDTSLRDALAFAADDLEHDLTEHLLLEETVVLPAVRHPLPATTQAEIVEELRARP